jgi:hypothetical protein
VAAWGRGAAAVRTRGGLAARPASMGLVRFRRGRSGVGFGTGAGFGTAGRAGGGPGSRDSLVALSCCPMSSFHGSRGFSQRFADFCVSRNRPLGSARAPMAWDPFRRCFLFPLAAPRLFGEHGEGLGFTAGGLSWACGWNRWTGEGGDHGGL